MLYGSGKVGCLWLVCKGTICQLLLRNVNVCQRPSNRPSDLSDLLSSAERVYTHLRRSSVSPKLAVHISKKERLPVRRAGGLSFVSTSPPANSFHLGLRLASLRGTGHHNDTPTMADEDALGVVYLQGLAQHHPEIAALLKRAKTEPSIAPLDGRCLVEAFDGAQGDHLWTLLRDRQKIQSLLTR